MPLAFKLLAFCFVLGTALSQNYPLGIPALANDAIVSLRPSSFVTNPETRWDNINNSIFRPITGGAPTLVTDEYGQPLSVSFNGSQCMGNDKVGVGSISALNEFFVAIAFTAPPEGSYTLFAQQSSPTDGYEVRYTREGDYIQVAIYVNGNQVLASPFNDARELMSLPSDRTLAMFTLSQQAGAEVALQPAFSVARNAYQTPVFGNGVRTLIGCNINGSSFAPIEVFEILVTPSRSWPERLLIFEILYARYNPGLTYFDRFPSLEFRTNLTGMNTDSGANTFGGLIHSAQLTLSTNATGWSYGDPLYIGHSANTSLDMIAMEGNVSRSSRVWAIRKTGALTGPFSITFDPELYLRPEIDWQHMDGVAMHLLLFSSTREYNWTVLATLNATGPAMFDEVMLGSGYITYAVQASYRTVSEEPVSEPISEVDPAEPIHPPVSSPVARTSGSIRSIAGIIMSLVAVVCSTSMIRLQ